MEEIESLREELDTDDVGQKRYLMYRIFDMVLERVYEECGEELPPIDERVEGLNGINGYIYKLCQEFLTSSSTLEKEKKLEKMIDHMHRSSD